MDYVLFPHYFFRGMDIKFYRKHNKKNKNDILQERDRMIKLLDDVLKKNKLIINY